MQKDAFRCRLRREPASFDPNQPRDFHRHIIFQRHLYGWDIQLLNSSPVIDRYLEHYIRYAFILHESWEAGRQSAEQLLHTFASACLSLRPPPKKTSVTFCEHLGRHSQGPFLENAKHIYPRTDLSPSKWVHMRAVQRWFQSGRGRCTAGTGPSWDTTDAFKHSLGLEQKLLHSAMPILFIVFLFKEIRLQRLWAISPCRVTSANEPI